ncbi:baeRF3 domain-containing protein [Paucihalobacter sp.]|uniref:baeRF3 domain-containing protein n=1 Tax=Paucihalobacter sp. TaxID=2850405 RepID=UPI002FE2E272
MTILQKLEMLASEKNTPCVTISLNTHRTHPDNAQDEVQLKNLLSEAEERVVIEFGKRPVSGLLERLSEIEDDIDLNYNLDSLHIYLSNDTKELIKSAWLVKNPGVHISNTFNLISLIKNYNRSEEYYILLLSQSGVQLYNTINDIILNEVKNEDFPFSDNRHYNTHADRGSDSKHLDDLVREFLNKVDKAVVKIHNETGLKCIVICTEDNFSRLMQVADKPSIYLGHSAIDYNKIEEHNIVKQSWKLVQDLQYNKRTEAVEEMKAAISQNAVLTDLQEIYQAAIDGRGDLLVVHQDYSQAVNMTSDRTFELTDDVTKANVIDDITSKIAWAVLSKNGSVFFTAQEEIQELGDIVLKTRY